MSWNINALMVKVDTPEKGYEGFINKLAIGSAKFREELPFDDAIDSIAETYEGVAIASAEGWTSVWGDPSQLILGPQELAALSKEREVLCFSLVGVSDYYSFERWIDGEQKRHREYQDGVVTTDDGNPRPDEASAFDDSEDEEDRTFGLMNLYSVPHRRLTKPKFHVFDLQEPS